MKNCDLVLGNSSSGILEAPSFKIPTINIGNRQNGRIQSSSIINCNFTVNEISKAIKKSMSKKFKNKIRNAKNPYFKKNTSLNIKKIIEKVIAKNNIEKKMFYDIQ